MDAVSYSLASKQAQRIENFIENPDSMSGIVTIPKVIASGETVTIPAGRVAVLPNVQIDGILNVEGEVFIPSGATLGDLDAQLALKAPLVNPAFTNPTATTQIAGDNSTKVATTAYVDGKMVLGTAVASTSGTAIDFTGIPSWVKKITVMFNGVSTNGISLTIIQLITSGGATTSGYLGSVGSSLTNGLPTSGNASSSEARYGATSIINLSGNSWVASSAYGISGGSAGYCGGGSVTLSSALTGVRITTVNGTDTFDAGQINIMYEG